MAVKVCRPSDTWAHDRRWFSNLSSGAARTENCQLQLYLDCPSHRSPSTGPQQLQCHLFKPPAHQAVPFQSLLLSGKPLRYIPQMAALHPVLIFYPCSHPHNSGCGQVCGNWQHFKERLGPHIFILLDRQGQPSRRIEMDDRGCCKILIVALLCSSLDFSLSRVKTPTQLQRILNEVVPCTQLIGQTALNL